MSWSIIVSWASLICGIPHESCQRWAERCLVKQFVITGDADLAFELCSESIPVELIVAVMRAEK